MSSGSVWIAAADGMPAHISLLLALPLSTYWYAGYSRLYWYSSNTNPPSIRPIPDGAARGQRTNELSRTPRLVGRSSNIEMSRNVYSAKSSAAIAASAANAVIASARRSRVSCDAKLANAASSSATLCVSPEIVSTCPAARFVLGAVPFDADVALDGCVSTIFKSSSAPVTVTFVASRSAFAVGEAASRRRAGSVVGGAIAAHWCRGGSAAVAAAIVAARLVDGAWKRRVLLVRSGRVLVQALLVVPSLRNLGSGGGW